MCARSPPTSSQRGSPSLAGVQMRAAQGAAALDIALESSPPLPVPCLSEDTSDILSLGRMQPGNCECCEAGPSHHLLVLAVASGELEWGGSGPPEYTSFALEAANTRKESCSAWPFHTYIGAAGVRPSFLGKKGLILSGITGSPD